MIRSKASLTREVTEVFGWFIECPQRMACSKLHFGSSRQCRWASLHARLTTFVAAFLLTSTKSAHLFYKYRHYIQNKVCVCCSQIIQFEYRNSDSGGGLYRRYNGGYPHVVTNYCKLTIRGISILLD